MISNISHLGSKSQKQNTSSEHLNITNIIKKFIQDMSAVSQIMYRNINFLYLGIFWTYLWDILDMLDMLEKFWGYIGYFENVLWIVWIFGHILGHILEKF